ERNFFSVFDGFLDIRAFRRYLREETTYSGGISNMLMLNSLVVFSLFFLYFIFKVLGQNFKITFIEVWGILLGAVFLYYWTKRLVAQVIGFLSDEKNIITEYVIYNKFYIKFMGVLLLPLMFFLNFLSYDLTNPLFLFVHNWLPWF